VLLRANACHFARAAKSEDAGVPLVVDVDLTSVITVLLVEGSLQLLASLPWRLFTSRSRYWAVAPPSNGW